MDSITAKFLKAFLLGFKASMRTGEKEPPQSFSHLQSVPSSANKRNVVENKYSDDHWLAFKND